MSDAEEREQRGLERLRSDLARYVAEKREEEATIARFRRRTHDLRGRERVNEVATFVAELVAMKVRRTPSVPADETRAALFDELQTSPSMKHLLELLLDPPVES
jgi:hypothetical protein